MSLSHSVDRALSMFAILWASWAYIICDLGAEKSFLLHQIPPRSVIDMDENQTVSLPELRGDVVANHLAVDTRKGFNDAQ